MKNFYGLNLIKSASTKGFTPTPYGVHSKPRSPKTASTPLVRGFTLLEVILAITVLTIAVGGSFALISKITASVSAVQSKLIASYLAQEGIEIVKNIRDTNWLKDQPWDQSLGAGNYEIDYLTTTTEGSSCPGSCTYDDGLRFLEIDGDGFYGYDLSHVNKTIFKRKITISNEGPDKMKVSVEVFWEERGKLYPPAVAQEYLYDWKP